MDKRSVNELRTELARLMQDHIRSLEKGIYAGRNPELLREHEQRLKRIREVSGDFLEALKQELSATPFR